MRLRQAPRSRRPHLAQLGARLRAAGLRLAQEQRGIVDEGLVDAPHKRFHVHWQCPARQHSSARQSDRGRMPASAGRGHGVERRLAYRATGFNQAPQGKGGQAAAGPPQRLPALVLAQPQRQCRRKESPPTIAPLTDGYTPRAPIPAHKATARHPRWRRRRRRCRPRRLHRWCHCRRSCPRHQWRPRDRLAQARLLP
jgi:hypothetical protein